MCSVVTCPRALARPAQESLKRDPPAGDLYVFRDRRGGLIKIIWHDGHGACLVRHFEGFGLGCSRSGSFRGKSENQFSASKQFGDLELDQGRHGRGGQGGLRYFF